MDRFEWLYKNEVPLTVLPIWSQEIILQFILISLPSLLANKLVRNLNVLPIEGCIIFIFLPLHLTVAVTTTVCVRKLKYKSVTYVAKSHKAVYFLIYESEPVSTT